MTTRHAELTPLGLSAARRLLRQYQMAEAQKSEMPALPQHGSWADVTVEILLRQQQYEPTQEPAIVKRGVYKFERALEDERLRRAEEIIRRVDTGPYEDPNYLAFLAYEAASIEMAFPDEANRHDGIKWSNFLIGTVGSHRINAFCQMFNVEQCALVVVYSALIDFMYQAAKAVAVAENPRLSSDSCSHIQADMSMTAIAENLSSDSSPMVRLYKTFEAYFFKSGYPRAFANEPVNPVLGTHLKFLVGLAERWVIAHEYGHGIAAQWEWTPPADRNQQHEYEFNADLHATILSVQSAHRLDHLPPEVPLASAFFALACLQILWEGMMIIRHGNVSERSSTGSHPEALARSQRVMKSFVQYFDVTYDDESRTYELQFVLKRTNARPVTGSARAHLDRAMLHANVLLMIWQPVKKLLIRDHHNGRALHSKWD